MAINTEAGGVRKTVVGALLLGCLVLGIIVGMTVDPNSAGSPPSLRRDAAAQKALDRESEKLVAPKAKSALTPVDAVAMKSEPLGDLPAQDDWEILFGQGAWGAEEDEKDVWNDLFKAAHVGEDVHQLDEEYSYSYTFSYNYHI